MSPRARTVVREVIAPRDPVIARAHRLLKHIFPKAELVEPAEWRDSLRERDAGLWTDLRWHLVVAESGGRLVGVATGTYLGNVNTGVIGYLAVTRAARHRGIGPRLRARLQALFSRDARVILGRPLKAIVGEVRRDNPWLRSLDRRERVLPLDFCYLQPRLHRGKGPVPLVFYYESFDRLRRRLSAAELRRLLYTIWRRIYRISRPLADPAFRTMLPALQRRRTISAIKV